MVMRAIVMCLPSPCDQKMSAEDFRCCTKTSADLSWLPSDDRIDRQYGRQTAIGEQFLLNDGRLASGRRLVAVSYTPVTHEGPPLNDPRETKIFGHWSPEGLAEVFFIVQDAFGGCRGQNNVADIF